MKKSHIIGIIVIALAIGVLISLSADVSTYVNFQEAEKSEKSVHVVGKLKKNAQGEVLSLMYNPSLDPNHFEFYLIDTQGTERKVVYHNPKPQDFERSEQIVIIGKMKNGVFDCDKILMKCPSKYQDGKTPKEWQEVK